ncbi:hypothetical protein Zmor_013782 [Zophobas morio]|uniref:Uncharacterized protein n=2 Tax=Zophobas morio TaxID=2755281 RepID=A0AA38MFG6_9CUCU|nr:hypothetical protein Zmor_013782 [Zophobas morio]
MLRKYLLFSSIVVALQSTGAKLSDPIDFLPPVDLPIDEESARLRRGANSSTDVIWKTRLTNLARMIQSETQYSYNMSLIGWQDVYDSSGKLTGVNSIELAFPPLTQDAYELTYLDRAYEEDFHKRKLQHTFFKNFDYEQPKRDGFLLDVLLEAQDQYQNSPILFYWTPIWVYFRLDRGLTTFNLTQTAPREEVDKFVELARRKSDSFLIKPVVLVYDEDGNLQGDEVEQDLSIFGTVLESWQASDEILLESPKIMAQIFLTSTKEDIPEELAWRFNQEFPEYDWRVGVNVKNFYLDVDVWVKLCSDNYDFYDWIHDIYFVYGVKI